MQEALQASLLSFSAESNSLSTGADNDEEESSGPIDEWACEVCTYMNSRSASCAMCGTARNIEQEEEYSGND